MNELDLLRTLGTRARDEENPGIDVAARVIREIARQRRRTITPPWPVVSLAACACVLLALAAVATLPARSDTLEALAEAAITTTGPEAVREVFQP